MAPPTTSTEPAALSARASARLAQPRFLGELTAAGAAERKLTLIETSHGAEHAADHIQLQLLVDDNGIVRDVRFRTLAVGIQLAAYDVMAELCIGKTLAQAATITPNEVDAHLRDPVGGPALPLGDDRDQPYYVLRKAAERLTGAKAAEAAVAAPPTAPPAGRTAGGLPWGEVGLFEKVRRIEAVLDEHVRQALASDGGGIDLVDLKGDDLHVQYHGACGSCSSSIGGTLQFIQDSLNNHLGTNLAVKVMGIEDDGMILH